MRHLTHEDLLDAAESPRVPSHSAAHLEECADCREQVDSLRGVLARAADDPVPEPSPLFWEHFSARVSNAIREQANAPETVSWFAHLQHPLTRWATVGAGLVLVLVAVMWRATLHAPSPVGPQPAPSTVAATAPAAGGVAAPAPDNPDSDARWAVVRVAAEDLAWEDVRDAGIAATPGAAEGVALELTADERSELARLLDREMKRKGA
jgi:hypothetical protein